MTGAANQPVDRTRPVPESSLATKIILLVFLSTFVSAAAVSWISIETARRRLWAQIHQEYPAVLERSGQHLLRWLSDGRGLTADLATRRTSRETLLTLIREAHLPGRHGTASSLFRSLAVPLAERSRQIEGFALLALDGTPIFGNEATDALSAAQRARLAQPDTPPVQAFALPDRPALLATAVPVEGPDGIPVAQLVGFFRPDSLPEVVASERLDVNTRIELLDADARLLAAVPGKLLAAVPGDGARAPEPLSSLPLADVREYTNAAGEHVIGSAHPLGSLGWALLLETPYPHAFAPVLVVMQRLLLVDVGVVALASLLAYAITSSIMRPIEALSEGAGRIASGHLTLALPETGRTDELGLLTRAFNEMMRRVQRSQADLEAANRRLRDQNQSLQASNEILEQLSITDGLTKLHNHRFFQDHLRREIKRVHRTGEALSMILIDIDDFKHLNDRLGHCAGDELLQRIARVLSESVRDSDLLARYGGDEFVVVVSGTNIAGAGVLAGKLCAAVAEKPFPLEDSIRPLTITVSAGVAEYKGDRKKFFQAADSALYRAKADGKNQVFVAE
jgi:diguanylate cyclase (GGDEF)-like protein